MTGEKLGANADMTPAELRDALQRLSDWVVDYRARIPDLPVLARSAPGTVHDAVPDEPPAMGESIDALLADLDNIVLPAVTHWNHPGFMAYFGITGSGPGILGELASAALNVNGMLWKTSPGADRARGAGDALVRRRRSGLPTDWFGMITDTASTLDAGGAGGGSRGDRASESATRASPDSRRSSSYCSEEAHSSVDKAGDRTRSRAGRGASCRCGRRIPHGRRRRSSAPSTRTNAPGAGRWQSSPRWVRRRRPPSIPYRRLPMSVRVTDSGCTWTPPTRRSAAIVPELRWALDGCERADSLVANPHKWLFTPIDCSVLYTRAPRGAPHRAVAGSRVPADRCRRGRRPDGLLVPARSAVSGAQAVVRLQVLRRRRARREDPRARAPGSLVCRRVDRTRSSSGWRRLPSRWSASGSAWGVDDEGRSSSSTPSCSST